MDPREGEDVQTVPIEGFFYCPETTLICEGLEMLLEFMVKSRQDSIKALQSEIDAMLMVDFPKEFCIQPKEKTNG